MKVTLVHDYLNQLGGAERVVAILHEMYPDAAIHTLFVDHNKLWPPLQNARIIPSFLQRFPAVIKHFKLFFWLYPFIIKNMKVEESDIVISSSSAYAKGVRLSRERWRANSKRPYHICYCHTPMRFAWDFDNYIKNETRNHLMVRAARLFLPWLQRWDRHTAKNVDLFIANSTAVQRRIRNLYHRESTVIHPPVVSRSVLPSESKSAGHFLVVSRLVSYKRLDLAIHACNQLELPLKIVGTGPDRDRLEAMAGPTIEFTGFLSEAEVTAHMASCRALIFPGEEDFGLTPLEANFLGRPVIAYQAGGALDTITNEVNGLFFTEQTDASLIDAIRRFDALKWEPEHIRAVAMKFQRTVFERQFRQLVSQAVAQQDEAPNKLALATDGRISR